MSIQASHSFKPFSFFIIIQILFLSDCLSQWLIHSGVGLNGSISVFAMPGLHHKYLSPVNKFPFIHKLLTVKFFSAWRLRYVYWLISNKSTTKQTWSQKWLDELGTLPWRSLENINAMWFALQLLPSSTGFSLYAIIKKIYYKYDYYDYAVLYLICALLIFRLRKFGKLT